jgi:uncharacterized membrane protein
LTSNSLHIISVHLPVVLTPVMAVWTYSNLKNASIRTWKQIYAVAIVMAIITSISYFTGPATAEHVKIVLQNYSQDLVESHALWGRIAFIVQIFAGLIGIMGLSSYLQEEKPSQKLPYILFVLLLINVLILLYTAHLGGMIRRPDLY